MFKDTLCSCHGCTQKGTCLQQHTRSVFNIGSAVCYSKTVYCAVCGEPLAAREMIIRNGQMLCSDCVEKDEDELLFVCECCDKLRPVEEMKVVYTDKDEYENGDSMLVCQSCADDKDYTYKDDYDRYGVSRRDFF